VSKPHIIAGINSVRTALKHGAEGVTEVWVEAKRRDKKIREIIGLAKDDGVTLHQVERSELDSMVPGVNHQGAVAKVAVPAALGEKDLESLLNSIDTPPFILILDGVQDPHNLGACLRSADAAGVTAVIAPKDRSVGLTPTVCKVASGAAETVPFIQVTNLARTIRQLQDEYRVWVVGTAGEAESTLYQLALTGPLAIVMGAEEKGMRRLTREACDSLVKLPMAGSVESLNVSVATGVCLFEAIRQRESR
jgi:23S rRNA (guanosine2251-2'-O)-methyltransferase